MISVKTIMPLSATLLTLSTDALAHPGHDHSHWSSPAMHTIYAAALVTITGVGIWAYRQHRQKVQKQRIQKEK